VVAAASIRCIGGSEYGAEVPAPPTTSRDGSSGAEGADGDAETPLPTDDAGTEASAPPDAASDAPDPCDKDRDGYRATSCGGNDCDDDDGRAHPGAGFLTDPPQAPTNGNWDCTGVVEKQIGINGGLCATRSSTTCGAFNGRFAGDPACGANDTMQICTWTGSTCIIITTQTGSRQGCK